MKNRIIHWHLATSLLLVAFGTSAHALTCTGTMNTSFGPYTITYEVPNYDASATEGYLKYWGPGTGAWTEGRYRWIYNDHQEKVALKLFFGVETDTCVSNGRGTLNCRSDMTPMTWDIVCE